MKKLILALSLVFLGEQYLNAQIPDWTWARQTQGMSYEDAYCVTSDLSDNAVTVGYYANDTCMIQGDTMMNAGGADFYIVKHDQFGNLLWTDHVGGSGDEYGVSVTCDPTGDIVAVGTFSSASITFGTFTFNNTSAGTPDIFMVRYSPTGTVIWANTFGGNDWDYVSGVIVDPYTSNIYVSGAYYNSTLIIGTDTMPNRGLYDLFVAKFNLASVPVWARSAGGNRNDLANAITLGNSGSAVYISGGFASDSLPFTADTLINAFGTQPDIFTVRYDVNGNVMWTRREGSTNNDHSVAIGADMYGRVYVVGHYHSTSFVFGTDTLVNMGPVDGDAFMIVYDTSGNPQWGITFGGPDNDFGHSVAVLPNGYTLITGMFMSMSMNVGSYTLNNASMDEDIFIAMFDDQGFCMGAVSYGGPGRDYLNSIHVSPTSYIMYAAGSFGSSTLTCNFDVLTNTDPGGTGEALIGRLDFPGFISESSPQQSVAVYPNPSNGIFNFTSAGTITSVTVYNTLGEIVSADNNINAQQYTLDLTSQNTGIYFYSAVMESGEMVNGTVVNYSISND